MKTTAEIDDALMEAERIRSRHDGVHSVHGLVAVLELCRGLAQIGYWSTSSDMAFEDSMRRLRHIDHTGFDVHLPSRPQSVSMILPGPSCCVG